MKQSIREKKVLMISYIFPPLGGGANQRTVRFVKYLGQFGWTPIVLTVRNGYYQYSDDYFLRIIPESVKIYRTFSLEPARFEPYIRPIKSGLKSLIRIFLRDQVEAVSKGTENLSANSSGAALPREKFYRKLRRIFNMYLYIPDGKIGWLPFAVSKGLEIIYKENPLVIWANADRPSALIVGYILKAITNRKLALNFSDPWVLNAYYPYDRRSLRARIDAFLEKVVIRKADSIVFATHAMQLVYEEEYPNEKGKFSTILNGYDPDEFKEISHSTNNGKFILTYCGSLQYFRSPEPLFNALEQLLDQHPDCLENLLVRFVGKIDPENLHYFESFKHKKILHITGQVSYRESIKYILESDTCLIIGGSKLLEWELPGKVFEFMAARKPIFVISKKIAVAELVERLKIGIVASPDDVQSIQSAITKLINERKNQNYYKDKEKLIEKYSRKSLTGELAACFDKLLA